MKTAFSLLIFCLLALTNCKQDGKQALLIGKWQGVSWKVRGTESGRNFNAVQFEFRADDTYTAAFEDQSETGRFRLSGDDLFTTAENKVEKAVKLSKLTADTLVMDMNRVGEAEELVLVKTR